jgi:hypothetical protein
VSRQPLPVRLLVDRRRRTGEVIWPPGIPDETIFPGHEIGLKRIPATTFSFEATEGDHAVNLLNAIYREFLNSAVPGMAILRVRR